VLVAETHAHTATAVDAGGSLDAADKNIELKANRVDLTDGSLTGKTVSIEATDTITQANTEKSAVRASDKASFTVGTAGKAGGSIHLLSEKNTFGKADVRAADEAAGLIGNVDLVTNAASGLTVNFGAGNAGTLKVKGSAANPLGVRVKNIANNQSLTLEGKLQTLDTGMAFTSGGRLTLKSGAEYTSARNMALTAQEDVTLENGATLDAEESLLLGAGRSVLAAGSLKVKGGILAEAKAGNVYLHQTEAQNGNISAHAENGNITMDEVLTHKGGIAAEAKKGDVVIGTAKAENGVIELKAANGKLTAEVLQAKENITAEGKDVAMKKVTAEKDLTLTAANKLTTADEVSAANITLAGGDITTAKTVNARNDLTLTAANSLKTTDKLTADGNIAASSANGNLDITAAEAKGGIDLKATNGKLTAEVLQAKANIVAAGKDVAMKQATAGNNLMLTATNSLMAQETLEAGGLVSASQIGGNGDITLRNVKAGSFYAEHSGKGDLRADDVYSHRVGFVHHEGVGDIRLDKMQVGHIARIRHTGTGDIFTRYLLAGREAHFLNRDGGMDLGFVDGGRRLTILDLSKQAKVRANVLRAGELLTIFSLHQEIYQFDTPTLLDLILAGDQTRQAVGWRGAAELGSLFETYWRRYEPLGAESFIDLRSWERTFAESVQANTAGEEAVTIGEDA